jgi:hypothetical protein
MTSMQYDSYEGLVGEEMDVGSKYVIFLVQSTLEPDLFELAARNSFESIEKLKEVESLSSKYKNLAAGPFSGCTLS